MTISTELHFEIFIGWRNFFFIHFILDDTFINRSDLKLKKQQQEKRIMLKIHSLKNFIE